MGGDRMIDKELLRRILFFGICVNIRILLIVGAACCLNNLGIFYVIIFSCFSVGSFLSAFYEREKGILGDNRWWFSSIHGFAFAVFVILVIVEFRLAWVVLLLDLLFGIYTFIVISLDKKYDIWGEIKDIDFEDTENFGLGDLNEEERILYEADRNPSKILFGIKM